MFLATVFITIQMQEDNQEYIKQLEARIFELEAENTKNVKELEKRIADNEKHMDNIVYAVVTGEWEKDPRE